MSWHLFHYLGSFNEERLVVVLGKYLVVFLVVGLGTVGVSRGDIVDGIQALSDSIEVWQTEPPVWQVDSSEEVWSEILRDTLDAKGDSVLIQYPALFKDRFFSSYTEVKKGEEKLYSISNEWQGDVWIVGGRAVGQAVDGWHDSALREYVCARLLQLRLLLHSELDRVNVSMLSETVPVQFTLVGRDVKRYSLSHDAALRIMRYVNLPALSHAFFLDWKDEEDQKVIQWGVFFRLAESTNQHVLLIKDRIKSESNELAVMGVDMRFLPGIRTDNVVDILSKETGEDATHSNRWTVEIKETPQ